MLTSVIKKAAEYRRLLAAVQAEKPGATALFGLPPTARAQFLAALAEDTRRPVLVVTAGEADAARFAEDLRFFGPATAVYPARDYVLRPVESQNHEYEYRRLSVLGDAVGGRVQCVCASAEAVLQYTVPKKDFVAGTLTLRRGAHIEIAALTARLYQAGYLRRFQVEGPGQFSVRGGIVDIYAPEMQKPCRLDFADDEIENIHAFDPVTQRRDVPVEKIHLSPAREVLFGDPAEAARLLRTAASGTKPAYAHAFEAAVAEDLAALDAGQMPSAMDKYLALRYEKPGTLFEYLADPIVFLNEPSAVREAARGVDFRAAELVKSLLEQRVIAPGLDRFYEESAFLWQQAEKRRTIACENFARAIADLRLTDTISAQTHSLPPWGGEVSALADDLRPLIAQNYTAAVLAGTQRAAQALARDLSDAGFTAMSFETEPQRLAPGTVGVFAGHVNAGADYPFARFALFTSRRPGETAAKPRAAKKKGGLSALTDIKPGDYVVHQNHGIGLYAGIERVDMQGVVKDYLKILYDKGGTLFVPVTQLDLISRYTAPGDETRVHLSRLGSDTWTRTKNRVRAATQDMAKELIALYARRQQAAGFAFAEDTDWQRDFETRFEYDETEDQLKSTEEIKRDMERPHPMDRLLCGDVGVGKTEVALRAVFKCIMSGKQAAILVPTTILAWQHYTTILTRMEAFPIRAGLLSRFATPREQKETLRGLADGTVDVVVGTHRLLQKDVHFHDLGLVVVDEEQRFGVKHKEKLKESFIGVDMLTLSATPIPRTLNMAMSGLRDMSTIEEPPVERQPIETYVLEYDENVVAEALRRELDRGGQAYYIHNRIDSIERCAAKLAEKLPDARIETAHGRMEEAALSRVWQRLLDGEIDILVCTTLIETGVDVRNCNTLVIEDADYMGLAQLYQIRGRVGRSGRKAYAYFTFRRDRVLTDVAAKRLSAIREFTSFGSGLRIAMRDLQIRGAGSLLGQSQHGHISAVGYDMYVKLLNQAIAAEKGEAPPADKGECFIDITVDAYIPEKYIPDASGRIEAYKRIAAIENRADAEDVLDELTDRYGKPPACAHGLVDVSLARVLAAACGVYEIGQKNDTLLLYSDRLDLEKLKPLLKDMGRRLLVNAVGRPYLSVRILPGEKPVEVMNAVLRRMEEQYAAVGQKPSPG